MRSRSAAREILTAYLLFYFAFRGLIQLTMIPGAPAEAVPVIFVGLMLNAAALYAVANARAHWALVVLCWIHLGVGLAYSWVDAVLALMSVVSIHMTRDRFRRPTRLQTTPAKAQPPSEPIQVEEKRAA